MGKEKNSKVSIIIAIVAVAVVFAVFSDNDSTKETALNQAATKSEVKSVVNQPLTDEVKKLMLDNFGGGIDKEFKTSWWSSVDYNSILVNNVNGKNIAVMIMTSGSDIEKAKQYTNAVYGNHHKQLDRAELYDQDGKLIYTRKLN